MISFPSGRGTARTYSTTLLVVKNLQEARFIMESFMMGTWLWQYLPHSELSERQS